MEAQEDSSGPDSPDIRPAGYKRRRKDSPESSSDESIGARSTAKKFRIRSDSESSSDSPISDISSMPTPEAIEEKLTFLQDAFPKSDPMELQDSLREKNWDVDAVIGDLKLGSTRKTPAIEETSPNTSTKCRSMKKRKNKYSVDDTEYRESESDGEEYGGHSIVYDSDDEEGDSDKNLTSDRKKVVTFFNSGTEQELSGIEGCSKKKVKDIINLRPFGGWADLVKKMKGSRLLNTELLNSATDLLRMKAAVKKLMDKCQKITLKIEGVVERLTEGRVADMEITEQPEMLNKSKKLTPFQMIGLNWLVLMHKQSINGILADEMGLGKTIQALSFLTHLKEIGEEGPHLIIVPSSTLENWRKEFEAWAPGVKLVTYWGSQEERKRLRMQLVMDMDCDIILTTYNMVISSAEDKVLFKKRQFHYVVFDEAHMLKNMASQRYESLMRINAKRKLLITGTPLQNNLVELMSLLIFVMPGMFAKSKDRLKKMFTLFPKNKDEDDRGKYELDRIAHAKSIMKPFVLRRLKSQVMTDLPDKTVEVKSIAMSARQADLYFQLVQSYKDRGTKVAAGESCADSGIGMLMNLRKVANHPLLIRSHYTDKQLQVLAKLLKTKDSEHKEAIESYIVEDLKIMSDFEIHKTCEAYRCVEHLCLDDDLICDSGKFKLLDNLLPVMKEGGDRVLIFSQFTMLLDILQKYLKIRGHKFLRLDGQTPVQERQVLIEKFNKDATVFVFILSTKAGGLGINLTAANKVILHDLDFNPYNDKQAEDRVHRLGQKREVKIIKFTTEATIEEGIYSIAQEKLKLEQDVTSEDSNADKKQKKQDVARLLQSALGVDFKEKQVADKELDKIFTEL